MRVLMSQEIAWLDKITGGYAFVIHIFLVIFITLLISYIEKVIYRKVSARLEKKQKVWETSFLEALQKPLYFFLWTVGFIIAIKISLSYVKDPWIKEVIEPARIIIFVGLFVWFLVGFIREIEKNLSIPRPGKTPLDQTSLKAISQLLRVAVIITATLVLLQTFNIPISGVLAFGGVGGIAVGFAAKDMLANFFGGLMIFLDRPFAIGDWIRSPDKNIEGTVEHIGWRLTRIRTFEKRPLFVPNSLFSTISVENPSRMTNRRIKTIVGLRYEDASKIDTILKDIEAMLNSHPEIDTTRVTFVKLVEFGPSSLNFQIYTFTKTTEWVKFQGIQQDVFVKVVEIIHKHDADLAFPTSTLYIPDPIEIKK